MAGVPDVPVYHELLRRLATDAACWDGPARVAALGEIQRLRSWLAAREAHLLAAVHSGRDNVNDGARDLAQLLQRQANVGFGEAKRRELRAQWLPQLPQATAALAGGRLGIEHVDALCLLAERLDADERPTLFAAEPGLVRELVDLTPPAAKRHLLQFEHDLSSDDGGRKLDKQRRANALRLPKNSDGTVGIHGQLDPIAGAELRAAVDARVTEIWRREQRGVDADAAPPASVISNERRRADALVELVRQANAGVGTRAPAPGAQLLVLIDHQTLLGQLATTDGTCRLGDGTPIPAAEARQLACQAGIIPIVLGSPSQPLDVGRNQRLATAAQRSALRAIHDTCTVEGCDVPFEFCEVHHLHEWVRGGKSDFDNLFPVCSKHHRLVHSARWRLEIGPGRTGSVLAGGQAAHRATPEPAREVTEPTRPATRRPRRPERPVASGVHRHPDRSPRPEDAPTPQRC